MFLPTPEGEVHWEAVAKSQLACVMNKYVGLKAHPNLAIPSKPPPVKEIDCSAPNIEMLKLMSALDNLAKGAGQIIEAILLQSCLKPKDFTAQVQIMDGNLGTCKNLNSLRDPQTPTQYPEHRLSNMCFVLGASHTLWNMAQNMLNSHLSNLSDTHNLGVWHYLQAMGVTPNKIIPKKDFTSMIYNIKKAHEASILYCIRSILFLTSHVIEAFC
ncbi:hypothetical protein PCANC_20603 [Puccinia coronata f. sp. avenae]|uniref:DUF6589 domain-containing protein n=1 Tax=Puccinia coronata f. sp. avenae TaxID=200324 RepID=A0A2N5T4Q9_9BASI|nr:hypothetical protein PCANC_20603 [Puccinia coronata f. sp. avenae]